MVKQIKVAFCFQLFIIAIAIFTARIMHDKQEVLLIKAQSDMLTIENKYLSTLHRPAIISPWKNFEIPIYRSVFDEKEKNWHSIRVR